MFNCHSTNRRKNLATNKRPISLRLHNFVIKLSSLMGNAFRLPMKLDMQFGTFCLRLSLRKIWRILKGKSLFYIDRKIHESLFYLCWSFTHQYTCTSLTKIFAAFSLTKVFQIKHLLTFNIRNTNYLHWNKWRFSRQ